MCGMNGSSDKILVYFKKIVFENLCKMFWVSKPFDVQKSHSAIWSIFA